MIVTVVGRLPTGEQDRESESEQISKPVSEMAQLEAVVPAVSEEAFCVRQHSRTRVQTPIKRTAPPATTNPPKVSCKTDKWQLKCEREFNQVVRQETESWQQTYERCCKERQAKLDALVQKFKQREDKIIVPARNAIMLTSKESAALISKKKTGCKGSAALTSKKETGCKRLSSQSRDGRVQMLRRASRLWRS